jgi:hypothetical protein
MLIFLQYSKSDTTIAVQQFLAQKESHGQIEVESGLKGSIKSIINWPQVIYISPQPESTTTPAILYLYTLAHNKQYDAL